MTLNAPLRVPCTYQGGKQRIAGQIAEVLLEAAPNENSRFYDLCCGSGAVSVELINRGVDPGRITMLDASSWGAFWTAIGRGSFRFEVFEEVLASVPADRRLIKSYMTELSQEHVGKFEAEIYPILQACSFGGKQLWWNGQDWKNAFFRSYWEPTSTSVRRSPANPMQPRPEELSRRVKEIVLRMRGVSGVHSDIAGMLEVPVPDSAVVYVDPPYSGTTAYGFGFDVMHFVRSMQCHSRAALFVSEGRALGPNAQELRLGGANGGISGNRIVKHREWLSRLN